MQLFNDMMPGQGYEAGPGYHNYNKPQEESKMEREIDRNTVVLQEDGGIGAVQIADDVVAVIASLATTEVPGVLLAGNVTNELISRVGKKGLKGVKVDVLAGNVTVDLVITVEFGSNIPAVCQKVQTKVKAAIENMTGLTCSDVNIRIAGVNTKKDK